MREMSYQEEMQTVAIILAVLVAIAIVVFIVHTSDHPVPVDALENGR